MADPVYGPGGSGYYTDPATGKRLYQTRYSYGADAYDPNSQSQLVFDPSNVSSTGSGTPTTGVNYVPGATGGNDNLTTEQRSAKAILADTLGEYGLGSLADKAWNLYLNGEPIEQVMLEIRKTPEYQARFPGMAQLSKEGRAISETDYINLEKSYVSLFRQSGLPAGFYDQPDDFANYIANEVSPQELSARLDVAKTAVYNTPPEVRAELGRLYNVQPGDVMAFLLDPSKALPIIQNQFAAAAAGAASKLSGYGALTQNEAEQVALAGGTFQQDAQGFDQLAQEGELFGGLPGEADQSTVARDEQLGATFGGNTAAQRRIAQRAAQRKAAFGGGGSFSETNQGITGLGSAAS